MEFLEALTVEMEQFFEDVNHTVNFIGEEITEAFDDFAHIIENDISHEVDQFWHQLFEPFIDIYIDWEEWEDDLSVDSSRVYSRRVNLERVDLNNPTNNNLPEEYFFLNPKVEPSLEKNSACIGCKNYHGILYGGNLLVCGMHPYGWEDENCPDWEDENASMDNNN